MRLNMNSNKIITQSKKNKYNYIKKYGKQTLDPVVRDEYIDAVVSNRRLYYRKLLISNVENNYSNVIQLLESNIDYWLKRYSVMKPQVDTYYNMRNSYHEKHKLAQQKASQQSIHMGETDRISRELDITILFIKYEAAEKKLENYRNMIWWIGQHLRFCYRKLQIIKVRFQDILKHLNWVAVEHIILTRIEVHMNDRVKMLSVSDDMEIPAKWVERYLTKTEKQTVVLDALQESLLREEMTRLETDSYNIHMFDSLIEELMNSLIAYNSYISEKINLDCILKKEKLNSNRGIVVNEQLLLLKAKMKTLENNSIDTLKIGLQNKYNSEDDTNLMLYGFPNDDPDLPIEEMCNIKAVLIDEFQSVNHCKFTDFFKVYLLQPWLAEQAVEDVRLEEEITSQQLILGEIKEELQGIKSTIYNNNKNNKIKQKEYNELQLLINKNSTAPDGESVEEEQERLQVLSELQSKLPDLERYFNTFPMIQSDLEAKQPPLLIKIEEIKEKIDAIQKELKTRQKIRERSSNEFFQLEQTLSNKIIEQVKVIKDSIDLEIVQSSNNISICQSYSSNDEVIIDMLENTNTASSNSINNITLDERALINVPKEDAKYQLLKTLYEFKPRTTANPILLTKCIIKTRQILHKSNKNYLLSYQNIINNELYELQEYAHKKTYYNELLHAFRDSLLSQRRQRANQLDLEQRKSRLVRLTNIRLKQMAIAKEAEIEQNKKIEEEEAKRQRDYKSTSMQIAIATKKAIRATKDAYRDYRYKNQVEMDEEEKKLANNIKERNKDGIGDRPEGIRAFHITVGQAETQSFQRQNDHLKSRTLPYYIRMERSIGNQTYIWTQSCYDSTQFITNLMLGHKDSTNENYINLSKQKYYKIEHNNGNMVLWYKVDKKRVKGIKRLQLTFTESEETELMSEGYEQINTNLSIFGLPETFLWMERIEKMKKNIKVNKYDLAAELKKVKKLLDNSPNDRNLQQLVSRLEQQLATELEKEKTKKKVDPITQAVEMLALEESDLNKLKKVFDKIDYNRQSKVTMGQLFEFFEETPTPINRAVWSTFDAVDSEGFVNYENFVKASTTFCLFGTREVLRLMFSETDKDRDGFITLDMFTKMINSMHPYDKSKTSRALKLMNSAKDRKFYFVDIDKINKEYPQLFHPLFALQHSMRSKILGIEFWYHKMTKYRGVRSKMAMEGSNTEELVDMEMQRFQADEAKEIRMAERDKAIKQETSEIKKTLLKARQFLDEFS